jgi:hypothetical protein
MSTIEELKYRPNASLGLELNAKSQVKTWAFLLV